VDTPAAAAALVAALRAATARLPVVLPLHPRGRAHLAAAGLAGVPNLLVVEPLGYVEFLSLVRGAAAVITDSGGIQEETTVLDVPCLTLRPNTERPVTLTAGTNRLVTPDGLGPALDGALAGAQKRIGGGPPGWDGHAGERIAAALLSL
jgi:UDP-N-acetylglucosamine 2-epimerase (non-hydrolysing)